VEFELARGGGGEDDGIAAAMQRSNEVRLWPTDRYDLAAVMHTRPSAGRAHDRVRGGAGGGRPVAGDGSRPSWAEPGRWYRGPVCAPVE
jgi:hypothetical protein